MGGACSGSDATKKPKGGGKEPEGIKGVMPASQSDVVLDAMGTPVAPKKMMITVSPPHTAAGTASTTSGPLSSDGTGSTVAATTSTANGIGSGTGQGSLKLITSGHGVNSNGSSVMQSPTAASAAAHATTMGTTGTSTGSASMTSSASATIPPSPSAAAGGGMMSIRLVGSGSSTGGMFDIKGSNGGSDATVQSVRKLTLGGPGSPSQQPGSPLRGGFTLADVPRHRASISQPPLPFSGSNNKLLLAAKNPSSSASTSSSVGSTSTTISVSNSSSVVRNGGGLIISDSPQRAHTSLAHRTTLTKGEELLIQNNGLNQRRPSLGRVLPTAADLMGAIPGQADHTDSTSPNPTHARNGSMNQHSRISSMLPPLQGSGLRNGSPSLRNGLPSLGGLHERTSTLSRSPLSSSTPFADDDPRRRSREMKRRTLDQNNSGKSLLQQAEEKKAMLGAAATAASSIPAMSDTERSQRIADITARIRAIPIPAKPIDLKNEVEFKAFCDRRQQFQDLLSQLHDISPKMPVLPLPKNLDKLRPFLSSTFRDFNEERNMCFKTAFPKVEKLCAARGLFFAPLDLRWGVTGEQSSGGQVIKICLDEIDRSRPYFICSLGFRNGWALPLENPQTADALLWKTFEIAEQGGYPWCADYKDRSVTELEILHGALREPEKAPRSYFYFRDIAFFEKIPAADRWMYIETGNAELRLQELKLKIVNMGYTVKYFTTPDQMATVIVDDLSKSIESDFPITKANPLQRELKDNQTFADMRTRVYIGGQEYMDALDHYVLNGGAPGMMVVGPSGSGKSTLLANWMKRFKARQQISYFTGNKYVPPADETDATGAAASGPPRLHQRRASLGTVQDTARGDTINVLHWNNALVQDRYIGSTADTMTPPTLLRWIMQEMKTLFGLTDEKWTIPQDGKKLIDAFPQWLEETAKTGPLLLVLDGLDQLIPDNTAHNLQWLPASLPKSVRLVCSTVPVGMSDAASRDSDACAVLKERRFSELAIQPLNDKECERLIDEFLAQFGKKLDKKQIDHIMSFKNTRNPLYLITFLQEVRVFGSYETLNKRIDHYMEAKDETEMFLKVIDRLEEDFDKGANGLVRTTLCLLNAAKKGLTDPELRGAMEGMGIRTNVEGIFPTIDFSALMLQLDQMLMDQRGVRRFAHKYVEGAVKQKYYVRERHAELVCHRGLVDYFASVAPSSRKAEEYPYQLCKLCDHYTRVIERKEPSDMVSDAQVKLITAEDQLKACLSDLDMFEILQTPENKFDLHKYWDKLEKKGPKDLASRSYHKSLETYVTDRNPDGLVFSAKCQDIATFLITTDRYAGAEVFLDQALKLKEELLPPNHADIEIILSMKANLFQRQGMYAKALPLCQRALQIVEANEELRRDGVRSPVIKTTIAGLLKEDGKYEEAEKMFLEAYKEKQALGGGDKALLIAASMNNLADLYLRMKRQSDAKPWFEKALKLLEDALGRSHPDVATCLSSYASCFLPEKKFDTAMMYYARALKIKQDVLGPNHLSIAAVLNNMAAASQLSGNHTEALKRYNEAKVIRENAFGPDHPSLSKLLENIATIHLQVGDFPRAIAAFQHLLRIEEKEHGANHIELLPTLQLISKAYLDQKQFDVVLQYLQRCITIVERSTNDGSNEERLIPLLNQMGSLYFQLNELDKGLPYLIRELKLCEQRGKRDRIADVLCFISTIYWGQDKLVEALQAANRAYNIRVEDLGAEHKATLDAAETVKDLRAMIDMGNMSYDAAGGLTGNGDDEAMSASSAAIMSSGYGQGGMLNSARAAAATSVSNNLGSPNGAPPPLSPSSSTLPTSAASAALLNSNKRLSAQGRLPPMSTTPVRSTRHDDDATPTAI